MIKLYFEIIKETAVFLLSCALYLSKNYSFSLTSVSYTFFRFQFQSNKELVGKETRAELDSVKSRFKM